MPHVVHKVTSPVKKIVKKLPVPPLPGLPNPTKTLGSLPKKVLGDLPNKALGDLPKLPGNVGGL